MQHEYDYQILRKYNERFKVIVIRLCLLYVIGSGIFYWIICIQKMSDNTYYVRLHIYVTLSGKMSRNFYFRMICIQILKWYDIEINIHGEKRSKYICYFICSLIYTSIIHICFDLHVTMEQLLIR